MPWVSWRRLQPPPTEAQLAAFISYGSFCPLPIGCESSFRATRAEQNTSKPHTTVGSAGAYKGTLFSILPALLVAGYWVFSYPGKHKMQTQTYINLLCWMYCIYYGRPMYNQGSPLYGVVLFWVMCSSMVAWQPKFVGLCVTYSALSWRWNGGSWKCDRGDLYCDCQPREGRQSVFIPGQENAIADWQKGRLGLWERVRGWWECDHRPPRLPLQNPPKTQVLGNKWLH